ncbi:hypothetical protein N7520_011507 [Penicillium odoratum]|uniref:uncharacterized protein n=1 Tax=Penicillium odoratum TaxID=1167516 RepID=UPI0025465CB8|nr:uncharacterized protein N7520_011507 [Penicillium odoratum]KAJ5746325.1 hypothetical protein N7520_011507 [Penicillium odoratum]
MADSPKVTKSRGKRWEDPKKRQYSQKDVIFLWACLESIMKNSPSSSIDYNAVAKKVNLSKSCTQSIFYELRKYLSSEMDSDDSSAQSPVQSPTKKKLPKDKKIAIEIETMQKLSKEDLQDEFMDEA